jgi:hypothetical protein
MRPALGKQVQMGRFQGFGYDKLEECPLCPQVSSRQIGDSR